MWPGLYFSPDWHWGGAKSHINELSTGAWCSTWRRWWLCLDYTAPRSGEASKPMIPLSKCRTDKWEYTKTAKNSSTTNDKNICVEAQMIRNCIKDATLKSYKQSKSFMLRVHIWGGTNISWDTFVRRNEELLAEESHLSQSGIDDRGRVSARGMCRSSCLFLFLSMLQINLLILWVFHEARLMESVLCI